MEERLTAIEKKLDEVLKLLKSEQTKTTSRTKKKIKVSPVNKTPVVIKKTGNAVVTIYDNVIIVTGNTYGNKEHIKSLGARWNKEQKGWKLTRDKEDDLRDVIENYFNSSKYTTIHESLETEEQQNSVNEYQTNNTECDIYSDTD